MNVGTLEILDDQGTENDSDIRHVCDRLPDGSVDTTRAICGTPRPPERPVRYGKWSEVDCVVCADLARIVWAK